MKAMLGNDLVDVWKIVAEDPEDQWVKDAFNQKKVFWDDELGGLPLIATFVMKEDKVKDINKMVRGKMTRHYLILNNSVSNGALLGGNLRGSIGDYLYKRGELYQFCSEKIFQKDFKPIE